MKFSGLFDWNGSGVIKFWGPHENGPPYALYLALALALALALSLALTPSPNPSLGLSLGSNPSSGPSPARAGGPQNNVRLGPPS